jgi:hypothetical protein
LSIVVLPNCRMATGFAIAIGARLLNPRYSH